MRNLEILTKFSGSFAGLNGTVAAACLDEFGHQLFVYTMEHCIYVYKYDPDSPSEIQFLHQAQLDQEDGVFNVSLEYVQELQAAVIALSNGEIYIYDKEVKEAGVLDGNILAAKWSPNEESYAVAVDNGQLYLFTPEFDILYEMPIDDDDLTFESEQDDRSITQACISWRNDSSIFQINYQVNGGFKCLTRDVQQGLSVVKGPARADDNTVFSVSEKPSKFLQRPICFMSNGQHVAGYRVRPTSKVVNQNTFFDKPEDNIIKNVKEIAFWERNGLTHGEFELPDQSLNVVHIEFNSDSSLMALLCLSDSKAMTVLICSRSNWNW